MSESARRVPDKLKRNWEKPILIFILFLAAFLTCYKIWEEGNGNAYYTAAVQSMLMNWHNFFFASFDPGGFITVDKPAPGLWLQCLFALVFGVHGWSVILPEALSSVGSVAVLYHLVKRSFGKPAGLLSALFLSLTPIFIAASRSNNLDGTLVLVCLLAVWAALKAAENGSLKLLILSMALIGLGFNMKMLQAFMFLPAVLLIYLFTANTKLKKRIAHLAISMVILLAVSLSWAIAVDMIPANQRPYVGSSTTNSELELALGYNGIERLLHSSGTGMGGNGFSRSGGDASSDTSSTSLFGSLTTSKSGIPNEGGQAGVLRLFNQEMAGQATWLLVFSMFGLLTLLLNLKQSNKENRKAILRQLLCWAGMFAPMYVFFSVSGHFHRYYLIMFAPCLAALSAIGFIQAWQFYIHGDQEGKSGWKGFLLPVSIAVTAAVQVFILSDYSSYAKALDPMICTGAGLSALALTILRLRKTDRLWPKKLAAAIGIFGILAAPAFWSYTPILLGSNASIPAAGPNSGFGLRNFNGNSGMMPDSGLGPASQGDGSPGGQPGGAPGSSSGSLPERRPSQSTGEISSANQPPSGTTDGSQGFGKSGRHDGMAVGRMGGRGNESLSTEMVRYMLKNYSGERFLVAVPNAGTAESIILGYGVGVMAIGGFKGTDNAISLSDFIALVQKGALLYYYTGNNAQSEIANWVAENGREVTAEELSENTGSGTSENSSANGGSGTNLYDLSALKTAG